MLYVFYEEQDVTDDNFPLLTSSRVSYTLFHTCTYLVLDLGIRMYNVHNTYIYLCNNDNLTDICVF